MYVHNVWNQGEGWLVSFSWSYGKPILLLLFRETVANNAPCIPSNSIQSIGVEHFFRCKSATFVFCNNNRYQKVSRKIFPKIYQQSEKNNFTPGMRLFRKPLNNKFGNTGRVLMEVPPLIFTRNSHRRRKTCQPISRKAIDARFCSHPWRGHANPAVE